MNDFLAPPDLRVLGPRVSVERVAAIDPTILPDAARVMCGENGEFYRLDKSSAATLDPPYVLGTGTGIGRWILDVQREAFAGDVDVVLDANRYAIYTGGAVALAFAKAAAGHLEQRVKSYLVPAGTATGVSFAADLNVNLIDAFDSGFSYLATFAFFSGVAVGTARRVQ